MSLLQLLQVLTDFGEFFFSFRFAFQPIECALKPAHLIAKVFQLRFRLKLSLDENFIPLEIQFSNCPVSSASFISADWRSFSA